MTTHQSISTSFKERSHWSVQPFIKFVIPLLLAIQNNEKFQVIELLRKFSPRLAKSALQVNDKSPREILSELKIAINALADKLKNSGVNVRNILTFIKDEQLMILDERIAKRLDGGEPTDLLEEETGAISNVMERYFNTPAKQMAGYQKYINEESAYSTQHGIQGAEFERVIVVLDDEEGNSNFYSYDKLFGITPLSERDEQNITEGSDNTPARTRRLFYVCCSRALKDLAVILFVANPDHAKQMVEATELFPKISIKEEADLVA